MTDPLKRNRDAASFTRGKRSIPRGELVRIVDEASEGCADSTRAKLRKVAETTEAVAVGWFHSGGITCPARQARRHNQRFQEAFDNLMGERFDAPRDVEGYVVSFVVEVNDG